MLRVVSRTSQIGKRSLLYYYHYMILLIIHRARRRCWPPGPFIASFIAQTTLRNGNIYWLTKRVERPVSPAEWGRDF